MKRFLPALLLTICAAAWAQSAAPSSTAATGPTQAWNVFTLPNEKVTPKWHDYAPTDCVNNYDACADDTRFWEEWDFNHFNDGIASSFNAVASQGKYQSVMMLMPLGDVAAGLPDYFANNIQLMYTTAKGAGVGIEAVLFPKWKYGAEWCYLYPTNAPSRYCQIVPGSTTGEALAYDKLLKLMDHVQSLGGGCTPGSGTFNSWFAIWYGWSKSEFPYQGKKRSVLQTFWQSLPTSGANSHCNLQASYITWLDSGYAGNTDVQNVQAYVEGLGLPYWVNTELYSDSQIQTYDSLYAPYQTIITGTWGATTIDGWAQGMCSKWKTASQPARLGVWTFYDRDVDPPELYRSYIEGQMADVGSICPN